MLFMYIYTVLDWAIIKIPTAYICDGIMFVKRAENIEN